jgi:hypothetical protein
VAVTSDQIVTEVHPVVRGTDQDESRNFGNSEIVWYWKVVPVDPGTAFEGIRGYARFRDEAERLVDANVANVLANGVAGITTA